MREYETGDLLKIDAHHSYKTVTHLLLIHFYELMCYGALAMCMI
jgi:hypothetical protein